MKSQISISFTYIISAIVILLLLIFSYKGITFLVQNSEKSQLRYFKNTLQDEIEMASKLYGYEKKYPISLPKKYDQICFIDSLSTGKINPEIIDNPIIRAVVELESRANVFLLRESKVEDSFHIESLDVNDDYLCKKNQESIWIYGKAKKALIKGDLNTKTKEDKEVFKKEYSS